MLSDMLEFGNVDIKVTWASQHYPTMGVCRMIVCECVKNYLFRSTQASFSIDWMVLSE